MSKNKFKWKKILSIMLAVMLVVALLPNTVNATETDNGGNTAQISTMILDEESDGVTDEAVDNTDTQADDTEPGGTSDVDISTDDTEDTETSKGESGEVDSSNAENNTGSDDSTSEGETSEDSVQSDESEKETQSENTKITSQDGSVLNSDTSSEEVLNTEAVETIVALIDDLPTLNDLELMTSEEQNEVYLEVIEIYETYVSLNDEEKALISEESLDALYILLEYFNSQIDTLEDEKVINEYKQITVDANAEEEEGYTYNTIQAAINYIYSCYSDEIQTETNYDGTIEGMVYLQDSYNTKVNIYPDDMAGWTITVKEGTYAQFSVLEGLNNLTIQAAEGATVTVSTWTGAENNDLTVGVLGKHNASARKYTVTIAARNITFDGLNFTVGTYDISNISSSYWAKAAITDCLADMGGVDTTGLTVKNCSFTNLGEQGCQSTYLSGEVVNVQGILVGNESMTISNCSFDGFGYAIAIMADSRIVSDDGVTITNNTFTSCDYALNCYYGGNSENNGTPKGKSTGTVNFTDNTVVGTSTLRSKVCVMDQYVAGSIGSIEVLNNTFLYTMVVIENIDESDCTVNSVLADNTWSCGSFYVDLDEYYWEGKYQGKLEVAPAFTYYESPESDTGYWVLNADLDEYGSNTEYVQSVIDEANATGSHTLSITFDNNNDLAATVSALKDCIYWVSGALPNLSKSILVTETSGDGEETTEEVNQVDVAAGDDVNYELTSNIPSALSDYIDYTVDEKGNIKGNVQKETVTIGEIETEVDKTYELTFYDEISDYLTINEASIVIEVGSMNLTNYKDDDDNPLYYTITIGQPSDDEESEENTESEKTESGANTSETTTLTVTIDLLALYTAEIIDDTDIGGATEITVSYTAQLSEEAPAGSYTNTAYVIYPEGETGKDIVQVDTYGLYIYKYDISTYSKGEGENTVPDADNSTPLANATFTLYDEKNNFITTVKTDEDGYASLPGLSSGIYYLIETSAPSGYVASTSQIFVEITSVAESTDESPEHTVTVQVANAKIPQTGGMGTQPFTLAGIALLASAGLVYVVTRRRDYLSR